MKPIPSTIFITLLASTLSTLPSLAATIRVPADQPTIQAGIVAAQHGDLVLVASGTYVENIDLLGKRITLQSEAGAEVTVIDGNQAGSVVTVDSGETAASIIDGFTIRNGTGTYVPEDFAGYGGGIYCRSSSPTVIRCKITGNSASGEWGSGGGICCYYSSPEITNCTISENYSSFRGGGVYGYRNLLLKITNCTIKKNIAEDYGGGICGYKAVMEVGGCTITENTSQRGGGIYCWECWYPAITIANCTISRNVATDYGGGIACSVSPLTIRNSTITGNSAFGEQNHAKGGGIYCYSDSVLTMENCKVSGNSSAKYGGGIYCDGLCHPNISNCIINNNTAKEEGGGIYCTYSFSVITGCTIEGNSAENYGGGIYYHAVSHILTNCILWCDTAPEGAEIAIDSRRSILDVRYSDIQGGEAAVYVGSECTLNWQDGNIDLEPLFAGEWDYRLSLESLCIDAGDPDPAYNDACFPPSLGSERNDMGAYGGLGACGWCGDLDGDGHESVDCGGDDCFDTYAFAYPGAEEICDGFDTDCDGTVPEGESDEDGDLWRPCENDCDDADSEVYPGAEEICDGKDNDCDGTVPGEEFTDEDGDGWLLCADCDDSDPAINPGTKENCSGGIDDDCDGFTDFDDPDCEFTLELIAHTTSEKVHLDFTLGTWKPAVWTNFLILFNPTIQAIELWSVPLPVIDPPMDIPIVFPNPSLGLIGIYTGLFAAGGPQAVKGTWFDTGTERAE